jgi:RHS repeat-associated protein
MTWIVQWVVITQNGQSFYYPLENQYSTKQQAVAAMENYRVWQQAQIPQVAEYGVSLTALKEVGISSINSSAVTYKYAIPPNATPTVSGFNNFCWSQNQGGCGAGGYTTEAAAVAAMTYGPCNAQTGASSSSMTATGTWTFGSGQVNNGENTYWESRTYTQTVYSPYSSPACGVAIQNAYYLDATETAGCPTGYSVSWNGTAFICTPAPIAGFVEGFPLPDCPANGSPSSQVGDPCDASSGDFSQTEPDYSAAGLSFTRYYHSVTLESTHNLGVGWTHNWAGYLVLSGGVPVGLLRSNGHVDAVQNISGQYIDLSGASIHIVQNGSNWIAYLGDGSEEVYNSSGQLIQKVTPAGLVTTLTYSSTTGLLASVADPFGHTLQFVYNANNNISTVTEPDGVSIIQFSYDSNNNLNLVTYPDSSTRQYQYQNTTFPNNLTGIIDEAGNQFLTVTYDPNTGAATASHQAGGAQAVAITYNGGSSVVTDSLGAMSTYTFSGSPQRVTSLSKNGLAQSYTLSSGDPQQRVSQYTDANNNITMFVYDTNHLTSKTEAYGTAFARTTSYPQYLSTNTALPTLVTEPLRETAYTYFSGTNNVETKTVTDTTVTPNVSRTWSYTYDSYGRVLTAKGPRTDVNSTTTYTYYTCTTGAQCGEVETVMDAVGNLTTYSTYNAHGQPLTITDPNGVVTTLSYDARQRLTSRAVGAPTETTLFNYYPAGLLKQVTLPDSSFVLYTYDGAHRLTQVTDQAGNSIQYTLDGMGNRTAENAYDPSGVLHRTHTRVINALNELYQDISAAGTAAVATTFGYDNNGNQTAVDAPLSRNTAMTYDALNRVNEITDPANGITQLSYDANDKPTSVQDPRSLTTKYTNNGFGQITQLTSPDTGVTKYTYDSGGNLATATDARKAVATYAYDASNRVSSIAYKLGSSTDLTEAYTYDAGTFGKGHLTGASDANHAMSWVYDAQGRIVSKVQTEGTVARTVGYTYTNGDLATLTTPSGQSIVYGYNANHQITSITVNSTPLLSAAAYEPLGPVNGWTWGNGTNEIRAYNTDGNISQLSALESNTYAYDDALRIGGVTNSSNAALSWTYGYDGLDRLTSAQATATTQGFTYDANSNRLTETGTVSGSYTPWTTSNRLNSVTGSPVYTYTYDAAGDTLTDGTHTFTYYHNGRLKTAKVGTATKTYVYNALGQRIKKSGGTGGITLMVYDETGHLLGEYSSTGALVQETVWLGDVPVATIRPSGSTVAVYYVHADHLNTPRMVTRSTDNKIVWRWDTDPFGSATPNQNPQGLGTFVYNLRFPGQYYDTETGLSYNYFRDYDPQVGRYVESDPLGLTGGVNTYAYVRGNPISHVDLFGLLPGDCYLTQNAAGANAVNDINWQSIQSNTEYAGRVYQNSDGTYSYTAPSPGTVDSSNPGPLTPNSVGTYHTHGGKDPGYYSENFSPADIGFSIGEGLFIQGYVAYLGTPDGVIKAFDPHSYVGDPQTAQFWNLPYPTPGQAVPCSCDKK